MRVFVVSGALGPTGGGILAGSQERPRPDLRIMLRVAPHPPQGRHDS